MPRLSGPLERLHAYRLVPVPLYLSPLGRCAHRLFGDDYNKLIWPGVVNAVDEFVRRTLDPTERLEIDGEKWLMRKRGTAAPSVAPTPIDVRGAACLARAGEPVEAPHVVTSWRRPSEMAQGRACCSHQLEHLLVVIVTESTPTSQQRVLRNARALAAGLSLRAVRPTPLAYHVIARDNRAHTWAPIDHSERFSLAVTDSGLPPDVPMPKFAHVATATAKLRAQVYCRTRATCIGQHISNLPIGLEHAPHSFLPMA